MDRGLVRGCLALWCAALLWGAPSAAQSPTWEDYQQLQWQLTEQAARLQELEMSLADPAKARGLDDWAAKPTPAGDGNVATPGGHPTTQWFGRIQLDYWPFPTDSPLINELETGDPAVGPEDYIGLRRLRFGARGDLTPTMLYQIEMEWVEPRNPGVRDAYLGWRDLPYVQKLLIGNQKLPYGLDALNSSNYNVFMERPFQVAAFNQGIRRMGVCSWNVSEDEAWNWRYGYFTMDNLAFSGFEHTDNYQSEIAGRLANTVWYDESSDGRGYAHWAISGAASFTGGGTAGRFITPPEAPTRNPWLDTGSSAAIHWNRFQLLGWEGVVNVGPWSVVGEYQIAHVERTAGLPDLNFDGYYFYVAYFLTGDYTPWDRVNGTLGRTRPLEDFFLVRQCGGAYGQGWGAWQIAARYSHGDLTDQEIFGGVGDSFTFGLNWWWTPYSRMQFNYIYGNISERANQGGVPIDGLSTSGHYNIFGTRFMLDF